MNRQMSFSAAVLILAGAGGLAAYPASAQSLTSSQIVSSAPGGSYVFNQGQCASGANGTLICSGPPAALIAPQGAQEGQAAVVAPGTVYGYEAPSEDALETESNFNYVEPSSQHPYLRSGEPGSMQNSTGGGE